MEKVYLWLVPDDKSQPLDISEAECSANDLPCEAVKLTKRYASFVVNSKKMDDFWLKLKKLFPYAFKVYEFSNEEILVGEHYINALKHVSVFLPWLGTQVLASSNRTMSYFYFVDLNATFSVTYQLLDQYLGQLQCQYTVLDCVKTEPAFYTGDNYYASKLKVQMHYADVLLAMGYLFKMVVENHRIEDEGSMTLLYGQFEDGQVRVFDRWCIPNIWTLSHDASFGHEMPLFCQWEFDQAVRKHMES